MMLFRNNSTTPSADDGSEDKLSLNFLIIFHAIRLTGGAIGLVGNLTTMVVIKRFKPMSNSHVIMWSLALADIISIINSEYES